MFPYLYQAYIERPREENTVTVRIDLGFHVGTRRQIAAAGLGGPTKDGKRGKAKHWRRFYQGPAMPEFQMYTFDASWENDHGD